MCATDAAGTYVALEQLFVASDVAIVGDLNDTPWSTRFAELLTRTGLVDSGRGRGWQPSFPAWPQAMGCCSASPSTTRTARGGCRPIVEPVRRTRHAPTTARISL
ncbi:MAG: endonuclease/exonuclease/phosphatase family protein [Planctomycetes bacterium]|nr:endonuclease/exonuclease/phosphatase family protein [Planctomycetota bacterium]